MRKVYERYKGTYPYSAYTFITKCYHAELLRNVTLRYDKNNVSNNYGFTDVYTHIIYTYTGSTKRYLKIIVIKINKLYY